MRFLLLLPALMLGAASSDDAAQTYRDNCSRCHGAGQGRADAPDLFESVRRLSKQQFSDIVVNGVRHPGETRPAMPGFGLTEDVVEQLDDLYVYLKARAESETPARAPAQGGAHGS